MAFPGTNSFIGEFLVLSGGFSVSKLMMLVTVPGIVAAAAYNLRMLQKFAYGSTKNPDHSGVPDLSAREILALAPLVVFVFWIGLQPAPFVDVMEASIDHLVQTTQAAIAQAAAVAAP
jgi:NADH-quinone oxidoreductase subunit M